MKTGKKLAWKLFSVIIATVLMAILVLQFFPNLSPKPLRLIRTWKAHKPNGQRLLSAHWDGTVQVWKVNYGTKKGQKKENEQFFECLEICAIIYSVFANFCAKISIKSFKGRDLMVLTFIPKRLANSKSAQWSPSLYFGSGS